MDSELKPLSAIGEFDLIQRYFHNLTSQQGVELGIGDDAAVVSFDANSQSRLVVATDSFCLLYTSPSPRDS